MIYLLQADAERLPLADRSVDLVIGSPPYMTARSYSASMQRNCIEWVDWMLRVTREACRVSRGLVLWVVAGETRKWRYNPGPEMLLAEWWKQGGECFRPCYWYKVGIPGSGGKSKDGQHQWFRADVEYVLAFKGFAGPLPYANAVANGHPPKWTPGGEMSHRLTDGTRVNQWGSGPSRRANGEYKKVSRQKTSRCCTRGESGGDTIQIHSYEPPVLANPGNLLKIPVGGGMLGHKLSHANEAPFPEKLAAWFIASHCQPGGTVLDPFSGSGTTCAAALRLGRRAIGIDLRFSMCEIAQRRCPKEIQPNLFNDQGPP